MGVDEDRQGTAQARRRGIITALNSGFDLTESSSHLSCIKQLIETPAPRQIIMNTDIDGLVSSQMLASVTGWEIVAAVDRDGLIRLHPDYESPHELIAGGTAFGVDVFSTLFPGVSNHPVHFGTTARTSAVVRDTLTNFDTYVHNAVQTHHIANLSAWVGIGATFGSGNPLGMPYKYPLGTAQFMLALLEAAGVGPRMYDRQYLPWLIANCDGGVDTIRTYAWNAETWWSAMAAAVGPASHSESIYRMVTTQRPNEFLDIDRRLRYDEPERSTHLNTRWNLRGELDEALEDVTGLITDWSGWPDPFRGGVGSLQSWKSFTVTRNVLPKDGLTSLAPGVLNTHLTAAKAAIHMNFSVFKERGTALGWWLPQKDSAVEHLLGVDSALEDIPEDAPSIPDDLAQGTL